MATETKTGTSLQKQSADRAITFTPFGENEPITLTLGMVRSHIATPTRSGARPNDSDLVRFMMLCKARELNPWVGDAFLIGYDTKDGPQFTLITAIQALLKRAEANPGFDGLESGVIVLRDDQVVERRGCVVFPGETLYGGWARCYRKDRSQPFYDALKLSTYDKGHGLWKSDPAGMIDKCAQASVLRLAFPTQLGALYIQQERNLIESGSVSLQSRRRVGDSTLNETLASGDNGDVADAAAIESEAEPVASDAMSQSDYLKALAAATKRDDVIRLNGAAAKDDSLTDADRQVIDVAATERLKVMDSAKSGELFDQPA